MLRRRTADYPRRLDAAASGRNWALYLPPVTGCYSAVIASALRCVNSANLCTLGDSHGHWPEILCNAF